MKTQTTRFLIAFATLGLLSATAVAQTMTVNPGSVVKPGEAVNITYADPSRANQTIVVTVSNNEMPPNNQQENLFITLDGHGKGVAHWTAPSTWDSATFIAPGVTEVTIVIVPGDRGAKPVPAAARSPA